MLRSVHSPATFSAFSCYIQWIQQWNNIPERDNNVRGSILLAPRPEPCGTFFSSPLYSEVACETVSWSLGVNVMSSRLVKERNLVSDSNVSKHLGFFGNDPRDTRPKIYVLCLHWGGQENTSSAKREAEVIFFLSPFSSLSCVGNTLLFFLSWKWSAGFESETFVERQKWSAGHKTENLHLIPSLIQTLFFYIFFLRM